MVSDRRMSRREYMKKSSVIAIDIDILGRSLTRQIEEAERRGNQQEVDMLIGCKNAVNKLQARMTAKK